MQEDFENILLPLGICFNSHINFWNKTKQAINSKIFWDYFGVRLAFYLSILKEKQMLPHGRCKDLETGGSSYSISWSISRCTET